jgi:CHAT domain-containing protein
VLREPVSNTAKSAVLIGNPLFTIGDRDHVAAATPFRSVARGDEQSGIARTLDSAAIGLRGPPWVPLPGTKQEVQQIARLLQAQRWAVNLYEGKAAVVEAIKGVQAPRLLHVATHGDFAADPAEARRETFSVRGIDSPGQPAILTDPMLRSGLFFTGANRYRAGLPPPAGADDGVLTAYEATQLNLQGTELVVLSACKTGLGQARDGEGVFGLRRAFQVAGAQAVMMTMWMVPDDETQELMAIFYQKWLAGADKNEALREAQRELRKRSGDRSNWGAFVLVGR